MGNPEILIKIGGNIKALRTGKMLTQKALAEACGFEKARISKIESGKANPTVCTLNKISNTLEVNVAEFFKN
ncbi:MAG: transcriptional regulator [Ferruginibacter sp.]|nr:transcriptional regulator [Ferruginibacter sp.]